MKNKKLTTRENLNMAKELSEKITKLVVEMLKTADKYEQSRDETIESVIFALTASAMTGSFEEMKFNEEEIENDRQSISKTCNANE